MYHRIGESKYPSTNVTIEQFNKHIDYISTNKINLKKLKNILKGIIKGCEIANCKLVGGETAEMPGTYSAGKFDIAGFSVGAVSYTHLTLPTKRIV